MNVEQARFNMIEQQIRPWDVLDAHVLDLLAAVRREDFVPPAHRALAFADLEIPLKPGEQAVARGQVMLAPRVEARMLQDLQVAKHEKVLEIGTGSGFLTACLARLAAQVVSVELHADFVAAARARLATAGIANAQVEQAEAVLGFEPKREFDAIAVTGAVHTLPERFKRWLKPGGRLFVIEGESPVQSARLYVRSGAQQFAATGLFETDLPYLTHATPPRSFSL